MIEVRYVGRMANSLFQYAFARILAERTGHQLSAAPIDGFEGTRDPVSGECIESPEYVIHPKDIVDPEKIFREALRQKIVVHGYMQRAEYYTAHEDAIREWLRRPETAAKPGPDDLVLHVRLSDFCGYGRVLDMDYYRRVIELRRFERIWAVTDEPLHPHIDQFVRMGVNVVHGFPLDDFDFIRSAKHIALCCSTFSWWAAFLSRADAVYYPVLKDYDEAWSNAIDSPMDLRTGRKNWIEMEGAKFDRSIA